VLAVDDMETVTGTRCRRVAAAGEDDEFDTSNEALRVFPTRQGIPLVAAHDPKQAGVGEFFCHGFRAEVGKRRFGAGEFKVVDDGPRKMGGGEPQHFGAIVTAHRAAAGLMR
jgi:hypothetical protein